MFRQTHSNGIDTCWSTYNTGLKTMSRELHFNMILSRRTLHNKLKECLLCRVLKVYDKKTGLVQRYIIFWTNTYSGSLDLLSVSTIMLLNFDLINILKSVNVLVHMNSTLLREWIARDYRRSWVWTFQWTVHVFRMSEYRFSPGTSA